MTVDEYERRQGELLARGASKTQELRPEAPYPGVAQHDYLAPSDALQPPSVPQAPAPSYSSPAQVGSMNSKDVNQWSMFIHLSSLCGFLVPLAGFIVPIVLWQVKKGESPVIDRHGKTVANWLITLGAAAVCIGILEVIALILSLIPVVGWIAALCIQLIVGLTGLAILVCNVAFSIMGGLKANDGVEWNYPVSLKLLK